MTESGDDAAPAPGPEPALEAAFDRQMPLIPRNSIAGRALVVVVAIMTFLACLTAGSALLVAQASQSWSGDVLRDVTIQVKPGANDDADRLVDKVAAIAAKTAGAENVRAYTAEESRKLLKPWLGDSLDLSLLPVPRIIVVRMTGQDDAVVAALRRTLAREAPEADLDDHRVWASRIGVLAGAMVALATALFVLVIVAMATAIGFATRGAVAENREIVEVLHFVGASDRFVANQFHGHFQRLGLQGAAIGGGAAFFLAASALSQWSANSPGGAEIAALFGAFALGPSGYGGLLLVAAVVTLLTGLLSRRIVLRHLRALQ